MIGLRIGAAELAEIEAGAPAVVLAPGVLLPHAPPLVPLVLRHGVLARPGADPARTLPLPAWVRPLALVGPEHAADRLLPLLPAGLPVLPDAGALLGTLAAAVKEAEVERTALAADRDRLKRALGTLGAPLPRRVLLLPPVPAAGAAELPLTQPLGRVAEGLCTVELHLVGRSPARGLRARLVADGRVLGAWRVPAEALGRGWLALDLPEPAAAVAEVTLELAAEPGEGEAPALSLSADRPQVSLALRAFAAPPGWSVLPRHFDWAASGAVLPSLPLPLPASLLQEAEAEGATVELVGAGAEPPRLILELPSRSEATLRLPAVPVAAADLLRLRLTRRDSGTGALSVAAEVSTGEGQVASGWREVDGGALGIALPLPPGPMATLGLAIRHEGDAPAILEVSGIALQAGAAGEARRPPPPEASAPARHGVALPASAAPAGLPQPAGWRAQAPAPRPAIAGPGGSAPTLPSRPAPDPAAPPVATGFQEIRLNQHLVNGEGTYRHLDIGVTGLVSGGGLWRQLRLKLFERRGVAGLEFRDIKGWPPMFDTWPGGENDNFGPFWRLETEGAAAALGALATPHDRALIAALLEVLPDLAARAAGTAGLAGTEAEAWAARARRLANAVAEARAAR